MNNAYTALLDMLKCPPTKDSYRFEPSQFSASLANQVDFDGLLLDPFRQRSLGFAGAAGEDDESPFEILLNYPSVEWYGLPESWQKMGLWLLHLLFSGREWAGLNLTHPRNSLKQLYVICDRMVHHRHYFLKTEAPPRYISFKYSPKEVDRHPLSHDSRALEEIDFPGFYFGWSDQEARHRRRRAEADQLIVATTPEGLCELASLLLDFGREDQSQGEINLKAPVLAHGSVEARFWRPGSFAFPEESLDHVYIRPPDDKTV
ncbi:hypothetical protein [Billgrantia aerodenitrificans]|uniref:Uncharacterized protein n=1 Tax=Billgrantia aerodenitrificans TaxID=2733483 RepID=A0ABS9AUS9_9GAMM|nr:hypothetical protein [Halomonas aerodenitrificans]MCE8025633.1 hypothetical protein [Halomonas aerodenitrificans]